MAAQRSASMAALDRQIKAQHPGIVVGWIRTTPGSTSDHYPDDSGLPSAQTDADTLQEVRALDPMIGPAFTVTDGDRLVHDLLLPSNRARLDYVIWQRKIAGRHTNWVWRTYDGSDPHTNHVHISGWAGDDSNGSAWTLSGGAVGFTEDMDAYAKRTAGGVGNTSAAQRAARANWRTMLATDDAPMIQAIEALTAATAGLANRIAQLETIVAELPGGTGSGATPEQLATAYRAAADALDPEE